MKMNAAEARLDDQRLMKLFETVGASSAIVMVTDSLGLIQHVNAKYASLSGYSPDEILGRDLKEVIEQSPEEEREMRELLESGFEWGGKLLNRKKDGETFWDEGTIFPLRSEGNSVTHFVKVAEDVTERKRTEESLRLLAFHDEVTSLPNKRLFHDRLRQGLSRNRRNKEVLAVLSLELDNFKLIQGSLGREAGDQALKAVSERLALRLRASDTLALNSGNSFKILLSQITRPEDAGKVARVLLDSLAEPIRVGESMLQLNAGIGIAVFPGDGQEAPALMKNSELALHRIREKGERNCYRFFTPAVNERAVKRMTLESDLRRAMERYEFLLYYQPVFDSRSGKLKGAEALVRWRHPERGLVPPAEYIPLAEETGLIVPLGEWILRNACWQCRVWQESGRPDLHLAVNLSAKQVYQPDLARTVGRILEETGLSPSSLELVITESAIAHDLDRAREALKDLKKLGVSIAIGDFSTGYSSLSRLTSFPVDTLKIDQSFVKDITESQGHAAIAGAMTTLAHDLDLKVVVEGGDTQEQRDHLANLGSNMIQGYLLSRPLSAEEFSVLMPK